MAFLDRLYTLCDRATISGAIRRNTVVGLGRAVDTQSNARRNTPNGFVRVDPFLHYFGGNETYINFRVHNSAVNTGERNYAIGLYTRDDLDNSGNLNGFGRNCIETEIDGDRLIAGATFHMALIPIAHYERYIQIGISSLSNLATEFLSLSAWISGQKSTWAALPEGLE